MKEPNLLYAMHRIDTQLMKYDVQCGAGFQGKITTNDLNSMKSQTVCIIHFPRNAGGVHMFKFSLISAFMAVNYGDAAVLKRIFYLAEMNLCFTGKRCYTSKTF